MKKIGILLNLILLWFPTICSALSGEQLVKGTFTATVTNIETVGTVNILSKGTVSISSPYLNNAIISSHIIGCSSIATITGTALTNQLLIAPLTGKKIYLKGIDVYNLSSTGGKVNFYWDSAGALLTYPSAIGGAIGNGYIVDIERRSDPSEGLYITTVPTSIALTVYYIQQE